MRPERYGEALHISERFESDFADSMRARSRIGCPEDDLDDVVGCLSGIRCRITSVTKCKSAAELTFGMTIASKFGACNYSFA